MLNSNKVSEIKIIVTGLLQDLDSLCDVESVSPLKWEELNMAADNIKRKINTLMIEQERYNLTKLKQSIAELKRSFSDVQLEVSSAEEEMELFDDSKSSILEMAQKNNIVWDGSILGPKIQDINDAITLNDKLFFVNGLFNDDEEQYRLSIQKLNEMESMDEALEYTRIAFPDWDEDSSIIHRFFIILRRRFDA